PDGKLGLALDTVLDATSDAVHDVSVREFVAKRDMLHAWIKREGDLERAIAALGRELGVRAGETSSVLFDELVRGSAFDGPDGARLLNLLRSGSKNDVLAAERFSAFVESPDIGVRADALSAFLFTDKGELRKQLVT